MRNPVARGLTLIILAVLTLSVATIAAVPHIGQEEITFGDEAAKEAESAHKILNDDAMLARVQAIGTPIANEANNLEVEAGYGSSTVVSFPYTFKIIDDDDVNAFSVPGGHIYIYKGLIENCQSDHELAGVIAHEIAHAAHHHLIQLLREQSRMEGKMAVLLVAGLIGDVNPRDMSNIMAGAQFYKTARINGYGQKAEEDADLTALTYMSRAGYNPVGMLTFLERLAERPEVIDWGILQTHPQPGDRVRLVRERLESEGVEINRRAVTTWGTAKMKPDQTNGTPCYEVTIGNRTVCKLRDEDRASNTALRINSMLDSGSQIHEIKADGGTVAVRGEPVVVISDADSSLAGKPSNYLAQQAVMAIRSVLFRDIVNDVW